MRGINFDPAAWEDFLFWLASDRKTARRITRLIAEISAIHSRGSANRNPQRRTIRLLVTTIDDEHRLVYRADDHQVKLLKARYHY